MNIFGSRGVSPSIINWSILTDLITRYRSLKILRLHSLDISGVVLRIGEPLQFHLQPDTELPGLEELAIPNHYEADQPHVARWIHAMCWSSMRRLDLGFGPPGFLTKALTGLVPQIKSLSVSVFPTGWHLGARVQ
jgi:hypothetical protein